MKYKVYWNEIKLAVINEYLVIKKLKIHEIQTKYQLSTSVLIYNWVAIYQQKGEQAFIKTTIEQTSHRIDKRDIEIKTLQQENEKLRQKSLKDEVEKELLKEQLACDKSWKNISAKNSFNCKCLKNKCFLIVEKFRNNNKITEIIKLLPISFTAYYKWVDKEKPNYKSKANLTNIQESLEKLVLIDANGGKYLNSTSLQKVIIDLKTNNPELKCSKTSVELVLIQNQINLLRLPIKPRKSNIDKDYKENNDLLARDFLTTRPLEKVGLDGTWFKKLIISGKKMKLLVELATDMHNDRIVGWKVGTGEDTETVLNVIQQVELESSKFAKYLFTTIQSDLGSANMSKVVENYFKNIIKLIHSKSLSGFKGNQVSECLNRWIKRDFKIMFGNTFDSIESFTQALEKFINWWNNDRIILRLKMSPNRLLQIQKQNIQLN